MRRSALVALLAVAAIAGCGGDDTPTAPEDVAGAWVEAMNDRDWVEACRWSVPAPEGLGMSCPELLQKTLAESELDMELVDVQVSGDAGSFSVNRPVDGLAAIDLERHDGQWRVHFEVQIIR